MRTMKIKCFLTGKLRKCGGGLEERTFLCIPADKEVKDVLSREQQAEFGNFFRECGEEFYTESDTLTLPQKPASELFKEIEEKGFATFIVQYGSSPSCKI